jgi:hypothetical protein
MGSEVLETAGQTKLKNQIHDQTVLILLKIIFCWSPLETSNTTKPSGTSDEKAPI